MCGFIASVPRRDGRGHPVCGIASYRLVPSGIELPLGNGRLLLVDCTRMVQNDTTLPQSVDAG
jgi:hypothetical protein